VQWLSKGNFGECALECWPGQMSGASWRVKSPTSLPVPRANTVGHAGVSCTCLPRSKKYQETTGSPSQALMFELVAAQTAAPCQSLRPSYAALAVVTGGFVGRSGPLRGGAVGLSLQLCMGPRDSRKNSAEEECHRIVGSTEDFNHLIADVGDQRRSRYHQGDRAGQSRPERRVSSCPLQPAAEQALVDNVKVIVPGGPCSGAG